jgi:hypothetical protein
MDDHVSALNSSGLCQQLSADTQRPPWCRNAHGAQGVRWQQQHARGHNGLHLATNVAPVPPRLIDMQGADCQMLNNMPFCNRWQGGDIQNLS